MTCQLFPKCGCHVEGDGRACQTKILQSVGKANLGKMLREMETAARYQKFNKLLFWKPYAKQKLFYKTGAEYRERLFLAGNQSGKTEAGAFEIACHLTGMYPDWWEGRRFDHPVRIVVAGLSAEATRATIQEKLYGPPGIEEEKGTGMVPKDCIVDVSSTRGVTDTLDTMQVRHKTEGVPDGTSTVRFMSYEKGASKFQGFTCEVIWLDEDMEPGDQGIYSECTARLTFEGMLFMTYTATKGATASYDRFMSPNVDDPAIKDRCVTIMHVYDGLHMSKEQWDTKLNGYPEHERETRASGRAMRGEGRVFAGISFDMIAEPAIQHIPPHWVKIAATDFGVNNFAYCLLLWDRDTDTVHVHDSWKMTNLFPVNHASKIKSQAIDVPIAWPQDGEQRDKEGRQTKTLYKNEGLKMLANPAAYLGKDGTSVEAGLLDMGSRMRNGKFKVAAHLASWKLEFEDYHRKDGKIVKTKDHEMDATRYALMSLRFAQMVPLGNKKSGPMDGGGGICKGVDDWDVNPL
jgi:phage terminase large subunit-like protein